MKIGVECRCSSIRAKVGERQFPFIYTKKNIVQSARTTYEYLKFNVFVFLKTLKSSENWDEMMQ